MPGKISKQNPDRWYRVGRVSGLLRVTVALSRARVREITAHTGLAARRRGQLGGRRTLTGVFRPQAVKTPLDSAGSRTKVGPGSRALQRLPGKGAIRPPARRPFVATPQPRTPRNPALDDRYDSSRQSVGVSGGRLGPQHTRNPALRTPVLPVSKASGFADAWRESESKEIE